jgi:hypothetical protein
MKGADQGAAETVSVPFIVSNARPVDSKVLFALVDLGVQIAGVRSTSWAFKHGGCPKAVLPPSASLPSRTRVAPGGQLYDCRTR